MAVVTDYHARWAICSVNCDRVAVVAVVIAIVLVNA
jgi:hypothetical protein